MNGKSNKNRIREIYRYASSAAALVITGSFALYAMVAGEGPNITVVPEEPETVQTDIIPDEILPPAASYSDLFFNNETAGVADTYNEEETDSGIITGRVHIYEDDLTEDDTEETDTVTAQAEIIPEETMPLEDIPAEEMTAGAEARKLEYLPEEEIITTDETYDDPEDAYTNNSYDGYDYSDDGEAKGALVSAANASDNDDEDEYDVLAVDAGAADMSDEPDYDTDYDTYDEYDYDLPDDDYDTYEYEASISEEEDAEPADYSEDTDEDGSSESYWTREPEPEPEPVAPQINQISNLSIPSSVQFDSNGLPVNYINVFRGKSTAYTADPGALTASGREVFQGYVAVDPDKIPYGTALFIVADDGIVYGYAIAADTGTFVETGDALIDLFMDDYDDCISWGARQVTVYVLG